MTHVDSTSSTTGSSRPSPQARGSGASYPPFDSPAFGSLVRTASDEELPGRVLAKAYRQLWQAGRAEEAEAVLKRLFAVDRSYIEAVWRLARRQLPEHQYDLDAEDLVYETAMYVVELLRLPRGAFAETAWVSFLQNAFQDVWRKRFGREGHRADPPRAEARSQAGTPAIDPIDAIEDGEAGPLHGSVQRPDCELEDFVRETIERFPDPFERDVADAIILKGRRATGQGKDGHLPLDKELGCSRDKINRALVKVRARLKAAIANHPTFKYDFPAVRRWLDEASTQSAVGGVAGPRVIRKRSGSGTDLDRLDDEEPERSSKTPAASALAPLGIEGHAEKE